MQQAYRGKVLLVSAPWALFNRPSLPIGALKAYLSVTFPGLQVTSSHLFLMVAQALGYATYQRVSRRVWRAESVFAALLYPDQASTAESLFISTFSKKTDRPCDFQALIASLKDASERWLNTVDWPALDLVGFTVSFCQITASLYLISRIKQICPSLPVVVGGSSFSGEDSVGLLGQWPGIDYLVRGEGELPLADLVRFLSVPATERSMISLPASILIAGKQDQPPGGFCQMERLERLPVPDYDDYFGLLARFPARQRFFPVLPLEASRGCWWHGQDRLDQFKGCAFCNLNLQWQGYRTKAPRQVTEEVRRLVQRHQVLSLAFADNALPLNHAEAIFDGIAKLGCDLSIFAELRANTPPPLLRKMKLAGVETVQVGIEALSSRLLSKMNKGLRAIDNLSMMKHCEAIGIHCASNLMLHFPSSDAADVSETMAVLDFALWYRPLKTVSFWLGRQSPVHRFPGRFNIRSVFNHPNLKKLFPEPMARSMRFIIQGYRGDRKKQRQLWRPVEIRARQWTSDYAIMQRQTGGRPALVLRDGNRFLIIDQHFPHRPVQKHRLSGTSAEIYRYCQVPRRFDKIADLWPRQRPEQIQSFLASMVAKRLMFAENDRYLSLAMPAT